MIHYREILFQLTSLFIFFNIGHCLDYNSINDASLQLLTLSNLARTNPSLMQSLFSTRYSCSPTPTGLLSFSSQLYNSALSHNNDMQANHCFSHNDCTCPYGACGPFDRMKRYGYGGEGAENIAQGSDPVSVINALIADGAHCQNLMNGQYNMAGCSISGGYGTQDFGSGGGEAIKVGYASGYIFSFTQAQSAVVEGQRLKLQPSGSVSYVKVKSGCIGWYLELSDSDTFPNGNAVFYSNCGSVYGAGKHIPTPKEEADAKQKAAQQAAEDARKKADLAAAAAKKQQSGANGTVNYVAMPGAASAPVSGSSGGDSGPGSSSQAGTKAGATIGVLSGAAIITVLLFKRAKKNGFRLSDSLTSIRRSLRSMTSRESLDFLFLTKGRKKGWGKAQSMKEKKRREYVSNTLKSLREMGELETRQELEEEQRMSQLKPIQYSLRQKNDALFESVRFKELEPPKSLVMRQQSEQPMRIQHVFYQEKSVRERPDTVLIMDGEEVHQAEEEMLSTVQRPSSVYEHPYLQQPDILQMINSNRSSVLMTESEHEEGDDDLQYKLFSYIQQKEDKKSVDEMIKRPDSVLVLDTVNAGHFELTTTTPQPSPISPQSSLDIKSLRRSYSASSIFTGIERLKREESDSDLDSPSTPTPLLKQWRNY